MADEKPGRDLFAAEPELSGGRDLFADPFITSATQPVKGEREGSKIVGAGEAALNIGSQFASMAATGLGIPLALWDSNVNAMDVDVDETVESSVYQPRTPEGQDAVKVTAELAEWGVDVARVPLSRLGYLIERLTGRTPEQAEAVQQSIKDRGVGTTMGESAVDLGAPPGVATAIGMLPDVALSVPAAGAPVAINAVAGKLRARANKPQIQVWDDSGRFTEEAINALEEMNPSEVREIVAEAESAGRVLTPEQAKRLNLFRERGVTPLAADITRKTEDSVDQQQALKEPGKANEGIQRIAAEQEGQIKGLVQQGIDETGGIAVNAEEASASVRSTITSVATDLDRQVTAAYNAAKQTAEGGVVDISDYIDFVRSNKGKDKITGGVVSSALSDLKNKGLLKEDADTLISIETAEEIRQVLNKDFDSATPRGRAMIREMKEAIDADVESTAGTDIFAEARQSNIRFKNALKRARRDKFDKSKGSLIEDILDNKIPEEKIFDKVVSPTTRADDLERLRDFLLEFNGEQAWNDLRSHVLRNALDKATSTKGFREGGEAVFNVRLFENELKRIRGKKFDLLFNADEKQLIADIQEIGNARIPISGTFSGEGPSSVAVRRAGGEIRDSLLGRIPAVGPLAEGMFDALKAKKRAKRLTEFTRETEEAINR